MSLRQRCLVAIVIVLSLISLPACHGEPGKGKAVTSIQLTAPNAVCQQNGASGTNVTMGQDGVSWTTAPSSATIEIHFASGCGFANGCDYGPTNGPISSGGSSLPNGSTIQYSSIKLGGASCNVSGAGLVMRH